MKWYKKKDIKLVEKENIIKEMKKQISFYKDEVIIYSRILCEKRDKLITYQHILSGLVGDKKRGLDG